MKTIRGKLLTTYVIISLIIIILLGAGFSWFARQFYMNTLQERLSEEAQVTGELLKPLIAGAHSSEIQEKANATIQRLAEKTSARITLIAPDGTVWADTAEDPRIMDNHLLRPEIQDISPNQPGHAIRYSDTVDGDMFYIAVPVEDQGQRLGYLRLSLPLVALQQFLGQIRLALTGIAFAVLILSMIISLKLSSNFTEPLTRLSRLAERISRGNLESRIAVDSNDETGTLAQSINRMAVSLEKQWKEVSLHKKQLETILNNMVDGIIVFGDNNRAVMANPAAGNLFGLHTDKIVRRRPLEIVRTMELHDRILQVSREGKAAELEMQISFPQARTLFINLIPITMQWGYNPGVLAVFHDITEIRRLERIRTDFAANVSHELKTPLTAIQGFAETLLDGAYSDADTTKHFAKIIYREANQLHTLIEDIMKLSQIESGKKDLSITDIDVSMLIENILERFDEQLKDYRVDKIIPAGLPPLPADYGLLFQALYNLVDNAIKYTGSGKVIRIGAELHEGEDFIGLFVSDTGIGIPLAARDRIFERFYRADRARSRKLGGTGLGLAIVKHIVELHNGKLKLDSVEGKGTRIDLSFPATRD